MDLITGIFNLDFSALVPELGSFLGFVRGILILAVLAGPIAMVTLGALYLFKPAPEANFTYGYRTYYGMGGTEAWRFVQKIAGLIFGGLGAVLFIVMFVVILCFAKDLLRMVQVALLCLMCQAALALIARLVIAGLAGTYFDKDGNRKK